MDDTTKDLSKVLLDIKLPTNKVSSKSIQAVVSAAKKYDNTLEEHKVLWDKIIESLWMHLKSGFDLFDDHLQSAKCFFSVVYLSQKQDYYFKEIENLIQNGIKDRENCCDKITNAEQMVALMNGLFQSSLLRQNVSKNSCLLNVLQAMFGLLTIMAYDYTKITGMVFKTIQSFKKICGTDLEKYVLHKENQTKLLNLVNHNWENPLTGVRDINKGIFQTLLSILDDEMYDNVVQEVNAFYWNKAKYIMLAEVVKESNKNVADMIKQYGWIDGLISSLAKPGLVSAGADMYFEILKKLNEKNWSTIFIEPISKVLNGSCKKTIENFSNYWCLTTFKTYPSLAEILINKVKDFEDSEHKLYSCLCIVKQANRLGLIKKKWVIDDSNFVGNTVLQCLEHCNNQIRLMAFEILCLSQKKTMRQKAEYDMVIKFLKNNVNSDCAVLRISMLNSFHNFTTHIHISYVNNFENSQEIDKKNIKDFCCKFQRFIVNNLENGGNYQRKITCIKLVVIFLDELTIGRQLQTKSCSKPIINMLKEEGLWSMFDEKVVTFLIHFLKDPAIDVRDVTSKLLTSHYSKELSQMSKMNVLIEDALKSMGSKFFYDIGCGQTVFKLIINIMMKETVNATLSTAEDVFNFAFNELVAEYKMKRNILEAIERGKQLHSYISILYVVLQVCLENKYKLQILDANMCELLKVLEDISNQFAWEQETSTSSDFSKMSDMVQSLIETSGYNPYEQNDESKITGVQQLVLNCLWLNVKGACELLSVIIKHQKDDSQIAVCKKVVEIISHVLETCRHKGAIEAAGVTFGQSIQHLTSLSNCKISELPLIFLKDKLNELINEAVKMSSVTRRGAGLSIMVHRIVSSDMKRHKPLFHYFMKTILETCKTTDTIPNAVDGDAENIDNVKDLPKAIYIHFLTRIVTDSSLASHMMFYSANLAELAFGNFTSPYWQIRNAALQLYGALVQKLIGQKKSAGTDEESIATVAYDELRTHSPKLWRHIQNQLQNTTYNDKVQHHSNLVPILNMLANTARRYNFTSDLSKLKETDEKLMGTLIQLLDSPIYTVRRLVAKCIFNSYDFGAVHEKLMKKTIKSENYLHGSLLLTANYYKLHKENKNYRKQFEELNNKYECILNKKQHSYVCKEIFEDIFPSNRLDDHQIREVLFDLKTNIHSPGIFHRTKKIIRREILSSTWTRIPLLIKILLEYNAFEEFSELLLSKIEENQSILHEDIMLQITNALIAYRNNLNSGITWKILYLLCSKTVMISKESIKIISDFTLQHLEVEDVSYKLRYMIPLAARMLSLSGDINNMIHIFKLISSLTDPEKDVEIRYVSALANNEIAGTLNSLPEACKIEAIKAAIILLQDEDEDVRILSTNFYPKVINMKISLQPYICLSKMLNHLFLSTILSESGILDFCEAMRQFIDKNSSKIVDEYNPFSNSCNNIYLEINHLRKLIKKLPA